MTRVMIVDDHELVAEGFARLIERDPAYEVVGVFSSGEALLAELRRGNIPDVCILDLALPKVSGADVLRTLRREQPSIKIMVVSAAARPEIAALCIREGALGFLSKFQSSEEFLKALATVSGGSRYIDEGMFDSVLAYMASSKSEDCRMDGLSTREYAVMEKIAQGMSIKEIAATLNLNAKTVSTYRARLLRKLNLNSNAELTAYCLRHGVIHIEVV